MNFEEWWKRETQCLFGHDWKKIGRTRPIARSGEFDDRSYDANYALGECRNCEKREFQYVGWGGYVWQRYFKDTKKEYLKRFNNGDEDYVIK